MAGLQIFKVSISIPIDSENRGATTVTIFPLGKGMCKTESGMCASAGCLGIEIEKCLFCITTISLVDLSAKGFLGRPVLCVRRL